MSILREHGMRLEWLGMAVLLPLGEFREGAAPPLESLREYAAAYFAMEVRVLPGLSLEKQSFTTRRNPTTGNRQLLTTDILTALKKRIVEDAKS